MYYMGTFIDVIPEFFLEFFSKISCYVSEVVILDEVHNFLMYFDK
jgi:hypothetical protein